MAENKAENKKVPEKTPAATEPASMLRPWYPFAGLRREMDRLFEDFDNAFWRAPFGRSMFDVPSWSRDVAAAAAPAVDIAETEAAYEIKADLPGMDEKNIEVKFADGVLTIKGEKREEKEEKKKDYYLNERSFGSFQRSFRVPDGVEADKIEANFKKGVLTIMLPKSTAAQSETKKIAVKAA